MTTPCTDDDHFKKDDFEIVAELADVCAEIVCKCPYLARRCTDGARRKESLMWFVLSFVSRDYDYFVVSRDLVDVETLPTLLDKFRSSPLQAVQRVPRARHEGNHMSVQ